MKSQVTFLWRDLLLSCNVIISYLPELGCSVEAVPNVIKEFEIVKREFENTGQESCVTVGRDEYHKRMLVAVAEGLYFGMHDVTSDTAYADVAHPSSRYLLDFLIEHSIPFQVS